MNNDLSCEDIMNSIDATSASAALFVSLLLNLFHVALLYLCSAITLLHSPARVRRLLARQGCSFFIPILDLQLVAEALWRFGPLERR